MPLRVYSVDDFIKKGPYVASGVHTLLVSVYY